jgi:uncharacterized membrane protein YphA (DoxX/SURF4 family)
MKLKLIGYWVATVLVAAEQLLGGITDLVHGGTGLFVGDSVTKLMTQLGYPIYLLTFMGVWSLLGSITLLVPRFPRLKEWAYAGIFFLYTAAAFSKIAQPNFFHSTSADLSSLFVTPLVYAMLTLVSWALRPPSRTLGVLFPAWARRANGRVNAPTEPQAISR